jgi:arsenite-transporting ATPase
VSRDRSRARRPIDDFLECLPKLVMVVGKGGVGKTTCALGLAALTASPNEPTLLLSTDPAGSLGPALGQQLAGGKPQSVRGVAGLSAMQLDPAAARRDFLAHWRDIIVEIVDRGTYLDLDDIEGLVDASLPGADEIFGLLVLADLVTARGASARSAERTRFVVDTAPTGHTLRLLALPETFGAMIALLDTMQAKHRFMVSALTRRYRRDAADNFLEEMRQSVGALREALGDPGRAAAVLVTRPESMVVSETLRYAEALERLGISLAALIVDAMPALTDVESDAVIGTLQGIATRGGVFALDRIEPPPTGIGEARKAMEAIHRVRSSAGRGKASVGSRKRRLREEPTSPISLKLEEQARDGASAMCSALLRTLTIVGGKGGVGKTTVACALALAAVRDENRGGDILLVSIDPAPSIADAFDIADSSWARREAQPLDGAPGLYVWQMDAVTAFQEVRDRYRNRIDALFDDVMGGSVDLVRDRAIVRDLLALAPPGIDELYALASLGDAIEESRYSRIVVDPAPTGHLLRLLELPPLAIEWSHRLMRLIMKYREVAGIGDAAQDLINFSRRTRALQALLHNEREAGVVLVTLEEPAVLSETRRLARTLRGADIATVGVVRNRRVSRQSSSTGSDIDVSEPVEGGALVFLAPESKRALIGPSAIWKWCQTWQQADR